MKLGKIKKGLALLMGMMIICPMIFAQESVSTQQAHNEVVKENVVENRVDKGVQLISEEELIALIKKNGVKVGVSKNIDGVKVTVEYIWADHCFEKVLLSIEHLDKRPFSENIESFFNYIQLFIKPDGTIDEKRAKEAFEKDEVELDDNFIVGNNLVHCDYKSDVPYKKYFIMSGGDLASRGAGQMVLELGEYIENEEVETPITSDAIDYLSTHTQTKVKDRQLKAYEQRILEAINQEIEEATTLYRKIYYQQERDEYLKYLKTHPQSILANQDLSLKVDDHLEDFIIKGIGFVDGALHISYMTEDYQSQWLTIYDEKGSEILATYRGEEPDTDEENYIHMHYDIYPIKNLEELKKCKIKAGNRNVPINGMEHALFDVNIKPFKEKVIKVNKKMRVDSSNQAILKTVTQTDLTLCLKFVGINKKLGWTHVIKIVTKDGTGNFDVKMSRIVGRAATYIYDISQIKGEIEKIIVDDVEVKLN